MNGYGSFVVEVPENTSEESQSCNENSLHHCSSIENTSKEWSSSKGCKFCVAFALAVAMAIGHSIFLRSSPSKSSIPLLSSSVPKFYHKNSSMTFGLSSQTHSPFFEVLPWTQNSEGTYEGAIEFCSNKNTNDKSSMYGYGLLGKCIPGRPAPLIRMYPLQYYKLTLVNNADIDTNLHTHGLHVSGVGTVDDVTRNVEPGKCLQYEYHILDDADVGTFWYHPHRHPLVSKEVYGGAFGMLIVDESPDQSIYPLHLENFLKKNEILLQFGSMYSITDDTRINSVNGHKKMLNLTLAKDEYYYFRISSVVFSDSINYVEFSPGDACEARKIAADGVYRSTIPDDSSGHTFMVTVSSRIDLAVRCSKNISIHFHQGEKTDESLMVHINVAPTATLTSIEKSSTLVVPPCLPSSPFWDMNFQTQWQPRRPYYMPNLSTASVSKEWEIHLENYLSNGTKAFNINDVQWDPYIPVKMFELGDLLEVTIFNSSAHPYHVHINRMQIDQPGGCGHWYEEGEWYDTIAAFQDDGQDLDGGCKIRTQLFDHGGRIVLHCHRIGHEDKGMMTWINVLGPGYGVQGGDQIDCPVL